MSKTLINGSLSVALIYVAGCVTSQDDNSDASRSPTPASICANITSPKRVELLHDLREKVTFSDDFSHRHIAAELVFVNREIAQDVRLIDKEVFCRAQIACEASQSGNATNCLPAAGSGMPLTPAQIDQFYHWLATRGDDCRYCEGKPGLHTIVFRYGKNGEPLSNPYAGSAITVDDAPRKN